MMAAFYACNVGAGLWWVLPVLGVLVVAVLAVNASLADETGCTPLKWERRTRRAAGR